MEYTALGNIQRANHLTGISEGVTAGVGNSDNPLIDEEYRHLIKQWNDRVHVLEAFNGSYFFRLPGQSHESGGAISGMQVNSLTDLVEFSARIIRGNDGGDSSFFEAESGYFFAPYEEMIL